MYDAHHLINAINKKIKCSIDWEGQNYLGLTLDWNYNKKYVDISIPGYIPTVLQKFQNKPPDFPQEALHPWNKPVYGKHIQLANHQSSTTKINSADTNRVKSINSTSLYYNQAVDPTMIPSLNEIFTCQSIPTQETMDNYNQFLDYVSTHPNATICYHASDMILITDTDDNYLVLLEARTHIVGYYYFTKILLDYYKGTPTTNGPISIECKTLKTVVSFSDEAETGGTFENAQNVIPLRHILENIYLHQKKHQMLPNHHRQSHISRHPH